MKHFSLSEFFRSFVATSNGIKNEPSPNKRAKVVRNINLLVDNVLDPIRDKVRTQIIITSGYSWCIGLVCNIVIVVHLLEKLVHI